MNNFVYIKFKQWVDIKFCQCNKFWTRPSLRECEKAAMQLTVRGQNILEEKE